MQGKGFDPIQIKITLIFLYFKKDANIYHDKY